MKSFRILALGTGLGAIGAILFYLITSYNQAIWFLEPKAWIRIPEIILGIFSIPILFKMMIDECEK